MLFLQRELSHLATAVYLSSVAFCFIFSILVWFTLFASLLTATLGYNSSSLQTEPLECWASGRLFLFVVIPLGAVPGPHGGHPPGSTSPSLVTREELGNGKI